MHLWYSKLFVLKPCRILQINFFLAITRLNEINSIIKRILMSLWLLEMRHMYKRCSKYIVNVWILKIVIVKELIPLRVLLLSLKNTCSIILATFGSNTGSPLLLVSLCGVIKKYGECCCCVSSNGKTVLEKSCGVSSST